MFLCTCQGDKLLQRDTIDMTFTVILMTDIMMNFFTEKQASTAEQKDERDIKKIVIIYLKKDFLFDLVTVFPFYQVF